MEIIIAVNRISKTVQVALLSVFLLIVGCATVYNPATEREEVILIDEKSEIAIGAGTAKRLEKKYPLYENAKAIQYVNRIGRDVARAGDRPNLEYHFKVLNIEQVNALALPGGFVYVTKGLLDRVGKDELAAVLGHEIGHIAARHGVKKLQTQLGYSLLSTLIFREAKYKDIERALDTAANLISLGYSRSDELLADRLGTRYSYRAGYNPQGMIDFLRKLKEMEKREPFLLEVLLSTHPPASERIKVVEGEINKLTSAPVSELIRTYHPPKADDVLIEEVIRNGRGSQKRRRDWSGNSLFRACGSSSY